MKTFLIKVLSDSDNAMVTSLLKKLESEKVIEFREEAMAYEDAERANEDQVQEIIDESELGPYYSEQEAKDILKL